MWVLFDLDGTLTQSEEGIWKSVRYTAEKTGFPEPDDATLRQFIGPPLIWSFQTLMGMTPEEAEKARKNLLAYCRLDTLAMVKVWEELRRAAGTAAPGK